MKSWLLSLSVVCVLGGLLVDSAVTLAAKTKGPLFGRQSGEEILDAAYDQIMRLDEQGMDVPEGLYEFYFRFEREVHPEFYANSQPDQFEERSFSLENACPGGVIEGPEEDDIVIRTCGQTYTANDDCSYPFCRYGNDVVVQLEVFGFDELTIRTAGSSFDTYLCLYEDVCCGADPSSSLYESNNNDPSLNYGQRLAAGIQTCVSPGTYWLVLDGASPAARGTYCLTIEWDSEGCD